MAVAAAQFHNANRGKDSKVASPQDFMWQVAPSEEQKKAMDRAKRKALWAKIRAGFEKMRS